MCVLLQRAGWHRRQAHLPTTPIVAPGLTRGPAFLQIGAWKSNILATGSDFCARYGLKILVWAERAETIEACIAHEKRLKRWRRVEV